VKKKGLVLADWHIAIIFVEFILVLLSFKAPTDESHHGAALKDALHAFIFEKQRQGIQTHKSPRYDQTLY
jgi:hypothetical protein